jgi:uncharacterized iron-regulated membrane protein
MTVHAVNSQAQTKAVILYRSIWRWHFYAGLFCLPFILILAISGSTYLFKAQIEAWLDRPYDQLAFTGPPASADAQVAAALKAVPGARLKTLEVRQDLHDAVRVTVKAQGQDQLVYVHPQSLAILKIVPTKDRFMAVIKAIHGELLIGDRGKLLVELAASWAIVMILTGLYLWWPRGAKGLAGLVYPRLGSGKTLFWRDLHAVTGVWVSGFALVLLLTGLPWTTVWGEGFKAARRLTHTDVVRQDWTTSRAADAAAESMPGMDMGGPSASSAPASPAKPSFAAMTAAVRPLNLAPPVLIAPPSAKSPGWTARSDAQNRPLRVSLTLDPATGKILSRQDFAKRHPIDRLVGYGTALHEGQLFGWANQLLGLITALGLCTLVISAAIHWWQRRPHGQLGAPPPLATGIPSKGLAVLIVALGLFLPVLGMSIVAIALVETLVLKRIAPVRRFLGLA